MTALERAARAVDREWQLAKDEDVRHDGLAYALVNLNLALSAPAPEGDVVERAATVEDIIASGKKLQRELGQANPTWSLVRKLLMNYRPSALHAAGLLAGKVDRQRLAQLITEVYCAPILDGMSFVERAEKCADAILREWGGR